MQSGETERVLLTRCHVTTRLPGLSCQLMSAAIVLKSADSQAPTSGRHVAHGKQT